jgi:hypothetical protein
MEDLSTRQASHGLLPTTTVAVSPDHWLQVSTERVHDGLEGALVLGKCLLITLSCE